MSNYQEIQKICKCCNKEVRPNQSNIHCIGGQCFWHKKCLKNKLRTEYDSKLNAGYNYCGSDSYKTRRCGCGHLLTKSDRPMRITKKTLKKIVPIVLVLIFL